VLAAAMAARRPQVLEEDNDDEADEWSD